MGGFFGVVSKKKCRYDLFYGTDYNSHMGTKKAGMVTYKNNEFYRSIHSLDSSYFRTKFEPELEDFKGKSGIGVISDYDSQPIIVNSHLGKYGIVTVGRISNIQELEKEALDRYCHFTESSSVEANPTEIMGMYISEGDSIESGIQKAFSKIKGSCSLLLLTSKGIIAARDKLGRTPIAIGKKDGSFAISSETAAFPNLGYNTEYYLGPGEIVLITAEGYEQLQPPGDKMQICAFLWIYYGYPASYYEGINVEQTRYNCGAKLAQADDIDPDYVSGIPDSGVGHAIGYSNDKGLPYKRPYVKYTPTWPRSFMPQSQKVRNLVARMKLIPIEDMIRDKRIVFLDDSIVRGTQLKDHAKILSFYGVKEMHMRIACPALIYPCTFLNFSISRTQLDLAGRKAIYELEGGDEKNMEEYVKAGSSKHQAMVEQLREKMGLTSLKYQKLEDMIAAIGLPREKICTHCWDGSSYS